MCKRHASGQRARTVPVLDRLPARMIQSPHRRRRQEARAAIRPAGGEKNMDLSGKTALVTGSARGIGRAIVRRFAAAGADVVINYVRSVDQAQAVAAEVQALGRQALVVQADVSQRAHVEGMLVQALQTFGKVDILVSNAGIIIDKPFVESTDDD